MYEDIAVLKESFMDFKLYGIVDTKLRASDIKGAIILLEELLAAEKCDRFSSFVGKGFTNPPDTVLAYINKFISNCESYFSIQSVYLEMNGFDINYGLWFFSPFGYESYEADPDDLVWLSDWQSDDSLEIMPLTGLEVVQADYSWYHEERDKSDHSYTHAYDIATLLVMAKFVALIQAALSSGLLVKSIPVIATAHEFDTVGRFEPANRL